jgi:DNA-directed RNA polymerase subunit H (RpoH/RPB5)
MSFVSSLPKRDVAYDLFRAKLSLMHILNARGYDLREDSKMLRENDSIATKYQQFLINNPPVAHPKRRDEFLPLIDIMDKIYTNSSGIMSPLIVMFSESKKVYDKIKGIMQEQKTKKKTKDPLPETKRKHYLFVVDNPVNDSQISSIIGINTLEILPYQSLFLNPLEHYRSPIANKLSSDDKEKMLSNPALYGKVLPGLNPNDPLILYLNMKPGDIYRSIDVKAYTNKQNMFTVGYRMAPKAAMCNTENCPNLISTFSAPYCNECLIK